MSYLNEHKRRKEAVVDLLGRVANYYERLNEDDKSSALKKLQDDTRNGKFSIVVVGQFSAGKSTFLNALMGDRYLPSFTTETTATINVLRSVNESPTGAPLVKVNYKDGTTESSNNVDLQTIEKFVSTKGKNVAQNVESVDVYFNSPYLNDGVCLVDSPGLNGVLEGHKEITDQQIKKSHAAIFMFNAAQPGSASDFRILEMLRKQCDSILIVLNRIDEIKEGEQSVEDVIDKLRNNYMDIIQGATKLPEIWPIAAYPALVKRSKQDLDYHSKTSHTQEEKDSYLKKSRIEEFEERLMRYLTQGEKTKKELEAPVDKIQKFLEQTKENLAKELSVLNDNTDSAEIESQIDTLSEEIDQLGNRIESSSVVINTKIHDILRDANNRIKSETRDIKSKYLAKIGEESELDELENNARMYVNTMNAEYSDVYMSAAESVDAEYKDLLMSEFSSIANEIEAKINDSIIKDKALNQGRIDLDTSIFEHDFNIDEYLAQKNALKSKLDDIDNSRDDIEIKIINEQSREDERSRLEGKIERERERLNDNLQFLGARPGAQVIKTISMKKVSGHWWWKKYTPVTDESLDYSAANSWDQERSRINEEGSQRISSLEEELANIPQSNVKEYEYKKSKLEREKRKLESEMEELNSQMKEQVELQKKKRVRHAKSYLESCMEEYEKNGRDMVIKLLKDQEDNMVATAKEIIKTSLEDVLLKKQADMKVLSDMLSSSKEEKEKCVAEKQAFMDEAYTFLTEAEDLLEDLDTIKVDRIKEA